MRLSTFCGLHRDSEQLLPSLPVQVEAVEPVSEDAERPANLVDECGGVGGEVDAQHSGRELRRGLQLLTCGTKRGILRKSTWSL